VPDYPVKLAFFYGLQLRTWGSWGNSGVSTKHFVFDALRPPPLTKLPALFKTIEDHIP
jgi:hypothetical protein